MEIPEPIRSDVERKGGVRGIAQRLPDDSELERESAVNAALGDPTRLKIMKALEMQPLCVCILKELVDVRDSKLSYHLGVLRDAGLVGSERRGNWVIYRSLDGSR